MQNGSFENMCKEKHCQQSVIVGRYIVDNFLQDVLENLSIRAHEFCLMINYEVDICEYY